MDRSTTLHARPSDFELDEFQRQAVAAVHSGASVLVAAPTGSGKTVVAEVAVADAIERGQRAFYTTPIKALSNQKFHDLSDLFGSERVGLLTGDNSIRPDAEVVVMTTEVLRNMIYSSQSDESLERLRWVILDEVHYLGDPYRGAVWEEVIIAAPASAHFVCLSATISNADVFGRWLASRRGEAEVVVSQDRPVELRSLHMVHDGHEGKKAVVAFPPVNDGGGAHHKWHWIATEKDRDRYDDDYGDYYEDYRWDGFREWRFHMPKARQVLGYLKRHQMLPAIYFVFSRNGCDVAARDLATAQLVGDAAARSIAEIAERRLRCLTSEERNDLEVDAWLKRIQSGVAAHHAGLAPVLKETVEECFIKGHIKLVFATETLALGMNMPARSVVISSISKFNGTDFQTLRPSEYAQMAGRAGRRGIDDLGHCVTLWSPHASSHDVVALDKSKSFPLMSAFSPNYNMVANLAARHTLLEAEAFLGRSFAQFLINEKLNGQRKSLSGIKKKLAEARSLAESPYGDTVEYSGLLKAVTACEADLRSHGKRGLKRGDVIADPRDGQEGHVVVAINRNRRSKAAPLNFVTASGEWGTVTVAGSALPKPLCRAELPAGTIHKSDKAAFSKTASAALRVILDAGFATHADIDAVIAHAADLAEQHPVASDPLAAERVAALADAKRLTVAVDKARRSLDKQQSRSELAKTMRSVSKILSDLGYMDGWELTDAGHLLARIHREQDLLVAETLRLGILDELESAELVAVASTIVYEHRSKSLPLEPVWPSEQCKTAVNRIAGLRTRLRQKEKARGLKLTPQGVHSDGFVNHAYAWAAGASLSQSTGSHLGVGDFVRNIHLTTDLLRQIGRVAPDSRLQQESRRAVRAVTRGVVIADAASQAERPHRDSLVDEHVVSEPPEMLAHVLAKIKPGTHQFNSMNTPQPSSIGGEATKVRTAQPKQQDYYSVSSLKHRGWTDAMIRDMLGDPDKRGVNPHYRSAFKTRLYLITRVKGVEATPQFVERLKKANARRAVRKQPAEAEPF